MKHRILNVLAVGGTDPLNGAGVTADLRTIAAHDCHGLGVVTAVIAQNSRGIQDIMTIPPANFRKQLQSVIGDVPVDAVKIGMVATTGQLDVLEEWIRNNGIGKVVYDPVMSASAGGEMISEGFVRHMLKSFLDAVTVVTPNLDEYGKMLDASKEMRVDMHGKTAFLVKGGHGNRRDGDVAIDRLVLEGGEILFEEEWVDTPHSHGTGCALSSSIAACLAKGLDIEEAIRHGKGFVHRALSTGYDIGNGKGPVNVTSGGRILC